MEVSPTGSKNTVVAKPDYEHEEAEEEEDDGECFDGSCTCEGVMGVCCSVVYIFVVMLCCSTFI